MFVQERPNMVIWNPRKKTDTTDATLERHREGGEEEARTADPLIEPERHSSCGRISSLLEHVRRDLNMARRAERWTETNQLQGAVTILFDATSGADPEVLSMRVAGNIFQRLQEQRAGRAIFFLILSLSWSHELIDAMMQKKSKKMGRSAKNSDPTHVPDLQG